MTKPKTPYPEDASLLDITVDTKMLLTAVQSVSRAVPSRGSLPILQHLLLTAQADGTLTLSATDLERFISCSLPASQVASPGQVTLPAKWISELLSRLPNSPSRLSVDAAALTTEGHSDRACRLKCAGSNYKVLGFDAGEFPCFPNVKTEAHLTIKGADLVYAIQLVDYACSKDEVRAILTGALASFRAGGDKAEIRLVATDTHRLAHAVCPALHSSGEDFDAILPAAVLADLTALAKGAADVTMGFVRNQANQTAMVSFEVAPDGNGMSFSIVSRLVDGTFPNWEHIVPTHCNGSLFTERGGLTAAARRAALVAKDSASRITLTRREDDALVISAESGSVGSAEEVIPDVAWAGDPCSVVAVNSKYFLEALEATEGDGVKIETTQALRPMVFRGQEGSENFALTMPMQIV